MCVISWVTVTVPRIALFLRAWPVVIFSDEINRAAEDNMLYKHPADFELIALGSYDDETAKFELLDPPIQLVTGKSCVVAKV